MKAKSIFYFLILISVLCESCKSIVKKVYGVSNPSFETEVSTISYLNKKFGKDYEGAFVIKDSASFYQLVSKLNSLPSVAFFNKSGQLIQYSDSTYCSGQAENFSSILNPYQIYSIDSAYLLNDISTKIKSDVRQSIITTEYSDIVLLVYWAKYLGKINSNVYEIAKAFRRNKKITSRIYFINLDFQKEWGMKKIPDIYWK